MPTTGKLRNYLPLEQGLRLFLFLHYSYSLRLTQKLSSIRTRIKTATIAVFCCNSHILRNYLPLEQGLRRINFFLCFSCCFAQKLSSIRTRIKTFNCCFHCYCVLTQKLSSIRTRIKTFSSSVTSIPFLILRNYLPLEQGLRPLLIPLIVLILIVSETIFH